jgi:hypothetical protein
MSAMQSLLPSVQGMRLVWTGVQETKKRANDVLTFLKR